MTAFVMILSLVMCNIITIVYADEIKWDFGANSVYRDESNYTQKVEGNMTYMYGDLEVDTTNGGKFDLGGSGSYAQVNAGTQIKFPVSKNSVISITTYSANVPFTLNEISYTSGENKQASIIYEEETGYAVFVMGSNDYIGSISVTPQVTEEAPTSFESEWDFLSDTSLLGENGVQIENSTGEITKNNAVLKIDATSGKWVTKGRSSWAQINAGTIVKVPVDKGIYTISVTTYSENMKMKINDDTEISSGSSKTAYGIVNNDSSKYVPITFVSGGYIGKINIKEENEKYITVSITGNLNGAKLIFEDTLTGADYAEVSASGEIASLLMGHTYKVKTDNTSIGAVLADGGESITVSEDIDSIGVNIDNVDYVKVTGYITSEDNGLSSENITSLTFVNMDNENVTGTAVINSDLTYEAELKPGNYNTIAETDNLYYTSNRVTVGENGVSDEEVYFSRKMSNTYYLADEISNANTSLQFNNFVAHSGTSSVRGGNGAVITVPVKGKQRVTVAGWYSGTWNINGENSVTANSSYNEAHPITNTYVTNGVETSVNVNITGSDTAYLYTITVADTVEFKNNLSVPGDYDTVSKAVNAVKLMERPDGEAGRVTIDLNKDTQEQVLIDIPYIGINGNGHTVSWYYGTTGKYYSVDKNGYYDENLFRDKYELSGVNESLWGGAVIVKGDHFYGENVTFKNTFNYEVTEKEINDGAVQTVGGSEIVRTQETPVTSYSYKERANALYTDANYIECFNCNILSGQDTLGVNGERQGTYAYFKNCKIGGNVDFICGGGNMLFDDCQLEIYGYSDLNYAGYITAAQGTKYLFRNCEVTGNNNGNGEPPKAYYGRPWTGNADVKFINTQTNGYIVNDGWADWSDGTTAESVEGFGEYCNINGDSEFKSSLILKQMTNEQYNSVINSIESEYLGGWTPINYVPCIAVNNNGNAIESVKINNGSDLLIYGYVKGEGIGNADKIGFVLSTLDNLFSKETVYTDNNVYEKIEYTSEDGTEEVINAPDNTYLFAYVVTDINNDSEYNTLYVRILQQKDNNMIYGAAEEIYTGTE